MNSVSALRLAISALVLTVGWGLLAGVQPAGAADDLFYHSTLADATALQQPLVGPPATVGGDGPPGFATGPAGPGLRGRGGEQHAEGSYQFPAAGWPAERGTLSFWIGLPDDWALPQQSMPIVMGERGKFQFQFDLRAVPSQGLHTPAGPLPHIAYWAAGEKHHVAVSWDAAAGEIAGYLDGVRVTSRPYTPVSLETFHVGSFGRGQANYATIISDLKIERVARNEFPEVPEELRARQLERVLPRSFAPAGNTSLLGTTWSCVTPGAEALNAVGGGVLGVRVERRPEEGLLLRPDTRIALEPTTLRLLMALSRLGPASPRVTFLVEGDDGEEREVPSRQIAGSAWSQVVSDYVGGERREMRSMRPDLAFPRGPALPARLTGMRLFPETVGLFYLRELAPSAIEYLKHRRWELVPPYGELPCSAGMHPFGPEQPEIWLSWILPEQAGDYRLEWALADVYQGPPIEQGRWQGPWDPQDPTATYTPRLHFPLPGAGTYWWTAKLWAGDGRFLKEVTVPVGVVRDRPHTPARVSWAALPRLEAGPGHVRVDTGAPDHVFARPDEARISVRVEDPGLAEEYTLRCEVRDVAFTRRLEKPRVMVEAWRPGTQQPISLGLGLEEAGAAYDVSVELLAGEHVLDRSTLRVGVRADLSPAPITISQPTLATTFGPGKVVLMNGDAAQWYATPNAPTELPFAEYYGANIADWQQQRVSIVRVHTAPAEMLPLPGLVDLRTVEARVKLLRDAGLPYMFGVSGPGFHYHPAWQPFAMQEDMSGLPYVGLDSWANAYFPSPASAQYLGMMQEMIRALYARYGNDPLFRGWVHQTDIFFAEHGQRRVEFSPAMQEGFVRWLREQKGLTTVTDLNARWGTQLGSWEEVDTPLPPARYFGRYTGAPDRTEHRSYRDWWEFRLWVIKHFQNDGMVRFARALGDSRPLGFFSYSFGQDEEHYLPDLIALGCFTTLGTEGYPSHNFIRNKVLMPFYGGHAYVAEYQSLLPGYKEMEERDADNIFATVMLAGGRNLNVNMFRNGPFSQTTPGSNRAPILLRGLERQQQWMEVLPAFARSELLPWEIGCYSFGESGGNPTAQYLWPRYPNHLLKAFMSDTALAEQKLIFIPPTDGSVHNESFTPQMRAQLVRYVLQGGRLVLISPDSGRYTRDNLAQQFALLTELGWPDAGALQAAKQGTVEAVPVPGSLFRTAGTLKLAGPLPEGVGLPSRAVVEARFAGGAPAVVRWPVGAGEVLLFVRACDPFEQPSSAFVDDLLVWAGVTRRVTAPCWFSYTRDGELRYLMLYVEGRPVADRAFEVQVHDLPEGRYHVANIGPDDLDLGVSSAAEWREGVRIPLPNGMLLLRFAPVD